MLIKKPAQDRGLTKLDWLDSHHSFSFGDYYDPGNKGFGQIRVINEDLIKASSGFDFHSHANMEIISYVTQGALHHQDSLGNSSVINTGEVQLMSAGTGITHSEFNRSENDDVRLFQIWIFPRSKNTEPSYQQKSFDEANVNQLQLLVSPDAREGSLKINQDLNLYRLNLSRDEIFQHQLNPAAKYWIQVISGNLKAQNLELTSGDALAIESESLISFETESQSELLLFTAAIESMISA